MIHYRLQKIILLLFLVKVYKKERKLVEGIRLNTFTKVAGAASTTARATTKIQKSVRIAKRLQNANRLKSIANASKNAFRSSARGTMRVGRKLRRAGGALGSAGSALGSACIKNPKYCVGGGLAGFLGAWTAIDYANLIAEEQDCLVYCFPENWDTYRKGYDAEAKYMKKDSFTNLFPDKNWGEVRENICNTTNLEKEGIEDEFNDEGLNESCDNFCTEKCIPNLAKVLGENVGEVGGEVAKGTVEVVDGVANGTGDVLKGILDGLGISMDMFTNIFYFILFIAIGIPIFSMIMKQV